MDSFGCKNLEQKKTHHRWQEDAFEKKISKQLFVFLVFFVYTFVCLFICLFVHLFVFLVFFVYTWKNIWNKISVIWDTLGNMLLLLQRNHSNDLQINYYFKKNIYLWLLLVIKLICHQLHSQTCLFQLFIHFSGCFIWLIA